MMQQLREDDITQASSVPGWSEDDKTAFLSALLKASRDIKKKELKAKIAALCKENEEEHLNEIASFEKELSLVDERTLVEVALPLDQEYDWNRLASSINGRHTPEQYQSLWKLILHPTINKSNWTKPEQEKLQKLATELDGQDWGTVAKDLNTGRSGYQCFTYYRRMMIKASSGREWTPVEEQYLKKAVDYFGDGYIRWDKVTASMHGRTRKEVYDKYIAMTTTNKRSFRAEEAIVMLNCHDMYGADYIQMAHTILGRSPVEIESRFNTLVKQGFYKTWSLEEDKKLIEIMENSNFFTAAMQFPGKDHKHLRARYISLVNWMKENPGTDLSMAPRCETKPVCAKPSI